MPKSNADAGGVYGLQPSILQKFDPYLEKIVEKHPQVAVVFKFLPFRSESSLTAARDALTVWRSHPEQFMKFNETLMAKRVSR